MIFMLILFIAGNTITLNVRVLRQKMLLNPLSTARELLKPEASWKRRAEDETSSEESEPMDTKDQENIDIETRKFFLKESGIDCDKF